MAGNIFLSIFYFIGRVGSCALCVLIYNNKAYTVNLGV